MKRLASLLALLLALSIAIEAAPLRHRVELRSSASSAATREIRISPAPGEIIIEFEATPLLLQSPEKRRSATANLDALFARLERDLAAIADGTEPRAAKRADAPRLEHRYTLAFAGASARVDPDSVAQIRALDYVRRVHPDRISTAYLAQSTTVVGAPQFWADHGVRGAGAVVAILDTGIDYTHPAFGGTFGPGSKVRGGRDFVNGDDDPMDDHGHGSHVAGIVAADGGGLLGVAPDATLLAYKVLDASGAGRDSWILAAIERAIQDGAHIVNMSLGRPATADDPVTRSVEAASEGGLLFAVAAGNSGRFLDIGTPGNAPSAITVGAIDHSGRIASFSSKGPVVPTGAIKPELMAPGVGVVSAAPGGGTHTASGTSMAAPHVAGVAALIRSLHPGWSGAAIRSVLIGSARAVDGEVMARGAGSVHAVDAAAALLFPSENALAFGITDPAGGAWTASRTLTLANGASETRTLSVEIDGLREGIELAPSFASITLAPGELADVTLALTLDPAKVPAPELGSLSFGGSIRLADESSSFSIPWGFVLATKVRVRWTGPESTTVRLGTAQMLIDGWTSPEEPAVDLFIGAGASSLWLSSGFPFGPVVRHVILEDLDLASQPDLTLGPEHAPHRLVFRGADLQGRLLSDRAGFSVRELVIRHPHFESRLLDSVTPLFGDQQVYLSDLDGETSLVAFENAFDLDPSATWAAQYPPIEEVRGDVELTVDPVDWTPVVVRGLVPPDLEHPYQMLLAGAWVDSPRGTVGSVSGPAFDAPGNEPGATARAWVTRSAFERSGTSILFELGEIPIEGGTISGTLSADLLAEFSSLDEGIVTGRTREPALSDAVTRPGETIVIGDGPVHPLTFVGGSDEMVYASAQWLGPYGEQRPYDAKRMRGAIYDAAGTLVAEGTPTPRHSSSLPLPFLMFAPLPGPGLYTFEAVSSSFDVAGVPAEATFTSRFDFGRDDPAPPSLTSLRILDGADQIRSTLLKGSAATLTFTAVDYARFGFAPPRGERTRVEYRLHDGAEDAPWTALAAVQSGEDFETPAGFGRPPSGVLYRVDLSEATRAAGPVDVRISIEDPSGNHIVYALEPAFVVRSGRSRPVARP